MKEGGCKAVFSINMRFKVYTLIIYTAKQIKQIMLLCAATMDATIPTSIPWTTTIMSQLCVGVAFDTHRLLKMYRSCCHDKGYLFNVSRPHRHPCLLLVKLLCEKSLAMTQCRETVRLTLLSVSSWCVIMSCQLSYWLVKSRAAELIATTTISWYIQCSYKCWRGVSHDLDH